MRHFVGVWNSDWKSQIPKLFGGYFGIPFDKRESWCILVIEHKRAQSAVAQVTPKNTIMHYYVSIPALDHRILKYAGYHSNDVGVLDGYKKHGVIGSEDEITDGPWRVLASNEYLGDRIDLDLQPYGNPPDFVPKQIVLTKKLGDTVTIDTWVRRTYPGDDARLMQKARISGCMLHCVPVDEKLADASAITKHIEIELAQKGLEVRATMSITTLAHKIHGLVDDGWEYSEAEWEAIKHMDNPPAYEELLEAYYYVEGDK